MTRLEIQLLKSVNEVQFGLSQHFVREMLGLKYSKPERHLHEPEMQELLNRVLDMAVDISGKNKNDFLEIVENYQEYSKANYRHDRYKGFKVCYDAALQFEAIEIYADFGIKLIIGGKDYSNFRLKDFLSLADDFVSEEDSYYTSYSKQIGITVSTEDKTLAGAILFGKPGYYQPKAD